MPIFFTGERGKVNTFLQTFNYFQNANHRNEVTTNPFQRANLLLMFMRRPKVKQWAARKGEELTIAVTVETMSPRLRATFGCKADALEMKEILNCIPADRRTNKRVK
jgi:hypothetical protein